MRQEILVAFSGGGPVALGNIWRITAKNTDFYIDPVGGVEMFHLSIHGPNGSHRGHRFHIKVGRKAVATVHERGGFMIHSISRNGYTFDGQELAPGVFRIARIRWVWDLTRPGFHQAASYRALPEFTNYRSGVVLSQPIAPNGAADLDLIASTSGRTGPTPPTPYATTRGLRRCATTPACG